MPAPEFGDRRVSLVDSAWNECSARIVCARLMDSDRRQQVESLFHAAFYRPPAERAEFLRQASAGDESLEREVRVLLDSEQEAGSFSGRTISHYRIVGMLGSNRRAAKP